MSWAVFKEKIESLKKTLLAIKSLDPKTQKPKYLVDLAANESLCNNINQFRTVLAKHEPNTQAPSFGLKKLGKASKSAFVAVINDCLEALLALNLQAELEKIIAKYEPTAKKIKEAEEKAQQAALEASKRRATTPGAIKTTVRHGEQAGYYEFGVPGKPGYADYGAIPSYIPEKKAEPEDKAGTSKGGGAKQEGKGPEAAKKEEKKGPESKKEDVKETETTKKVENLYYEFEGSLDDILDTLKQLPNLQNLKSKLEHSQDPKELDNIARELNNLSSMVRSARKKVKDAGNRIADLGKGPQHDKWVTNFKTGWASYRGEFVHLRDLLLQHSY